MREKGFVGLKGIVKEMRCLQRMEPVIPSSRSLPMTAYNTKVSKSTTEVSYLRVIAVHITVTYSTPRRN